MSASTGEDIVIVESTDYAQVVFDDVKEAFTNAKELECLFTLNELVEVHPTDWVGIYKVGFENCNEYTCYLEIDPTIIKDNKAKVVFPIEVLPKEDGEFYQFVYVSQMKQIRGASIPFQFTVNDCTAYLDDEDQDAVIVKFELNDTITEIKSRCIQLAKANDKYEKIVKENEELIKSLKEEVASIKLRCFRLTMDNEKLNFTLRSKADNLKNLAETITNLTNENTNLQTRFNDLTNDHNNLVESLQQKIDQVSILKDELEAVKLNKVELENVLSLKEFELMKLEREKDELQKVSNELQRISDQISKLEKQVTERVEELHHIKNDLKKNTLIVTEQAQTIQNILNERDTLNKLIQKLNKEKSDLENLNHLALQELTMSKEKLSASEQCKDMLRAQLLVLSDELEESKKKLAATNDLNNRLAQTEIEKCTFDTKIAQVKSEYENKLNEFKGSYHVLRVAHNALETRLKAGESRRETLEKENDSQKKTIEELNQENQELKERIRHGAMEYTKLFEKNRLLKNQKFNSEINIYHDLTGEEIRYSGRTTQPRQQQLNSTPSEDKLTPDSVTDEKTISQIARASNDEIENTLLDALLGSSFYNTTWSGLNQRDQRLPSNSQLPTVTSAIATTTQPKPSQNQATDLSDDGLTNNNSSAKLSNQMYEKLQLNEMNQFSQSNSIQNFDSRISQCEICQYVFPTGINQAEIEKHYSLHYGPTCPVCFTQFRKGFPQAELEKHVNSHFTN